MNRYSVTRRIDFSVAKIFWFFWSSYTSIDSSVKTFLSADESQCQLNFFKSVCIIFSECPGIVLFTGHIYSPLKCYLRHEPALLYLALVRLLSVSSLRQTVILYNDFVSLFVLFISVRVDQCVSPSRQYSGFITVRLTFAVVSYSSVSFYRCHFRLCFPNCMTWGAFNKSILSKWVFAIAIHLCMYLTLSGFCARISSALVLM